MPRGTGAFGDSPEIETEKCNRTDIDLFYHGIKEDFENGWIEMKEDFENGWIEMKEDFENGWIEIKEDFENGLIEM